MQNNSDPQSVSGGRVDQVTDAIDDGAELPQDIKSPLSVRVANIWAKRWWVLFSTIVFAVLLSGIGALIKPKYRSSVTVLPLSAAAPSALSQIGSAGSMLGGLGSLIGLSKLGGSFKQESIATLKSNRIAAEYIRANNLVPVLFRKLWDSQNQKWKTNNSNETPSLWKAVRLFRKKICTVTEDRQTGLVTVSVEWTNPVLAAQWANGLVSLTNSSLREYAITTAEKHIAFLRAQIQKTRQIDLRNDIYSLMKSELEQEMIARGRTEYALRVIDPAMVPEKSVTPSILDLFCIGAFVGLISGLFLVSRQRLSKR